MRQPLPFLRSDLLAPVLKLGIRKPALRLLLPRVRDVLNIKAGDIGDSPAISPQYEELMDVVSRAVAKLNIEWPSEKQEAQKKSKLDVCFSSAPCC